MLSTLACEANDPVGDEVASTADTETSETADEEVCELWALDATYPGDRACAAPGEARVQGCTKPDGVQTCADVCAALGETCVENACDGGDLRRRHRLPRGRSITTRRWRSAA